MTGISAEKVVGENDFGSLIIEDSEGRHWRLCPESFYCTLVAANREELDALPQDQEFLRDRYMARLVDEVVKKCGAMDEGRKHCLKVPGPLGGEHGGDNLATISLYELIRANG
ncbi:T6SS immunity protein Tdi1 domain-containing protein [Noviherbaspirillum sp.]|uniref:T6SS immunity protein Tdi1 domain-containing protein n=1 Tax=Noviherbaspirillum sp. TaxID=1926288 RepID=UPI0025ECB060|nr:T6SS immunity protein Tdi1 domain-containing protein [Noviherbaspirillum sp.]